MADKAFWVRDPVHGYVAVAPHERIIVDHPVTQRLRNISQTGLAHLVFPEARTSRFAHSLGAMHVASQFLVDSVQHASPEARKTFFECAEQIVFDDEIVFGPNDVDLESSRPFGGGALLAPQADIGAGLSPGEAQRRRKILTLLESALRLAALFHDLGHLPFSHDFEPALRQYLGSSGKTYPEAVRALAAETPHEEIGHQLADVVLRQLVRGRPDAERRAYSLAVKILNEETPYFASRQPQATLLQWLHSLIDGEIDVDRADYLLRDGRALGFDFASYDLVRLRLNLALHYDDSFGFITTIGEAGLGALESFLMSRARSNQAFIRHHKVSETAAALQYATVAGLGESEGGTLVQFLMDLSANSREASKESLLSTFAAYDDVLWLMVLRRLLEKTPSKLLKASLRSVLNRERSLVSIWKRTGDLAPDLVEQLNVSLLGDQEQLKRRIEDLNAQNILVSVYRFKPYGTWPNGEKGESIILLNTGRGLGPASNHSPLIRSLVTAWEYDVHVHAFRCAEDDQAASLSLATGCLLGR